MMSILLKSSIRCRPVWTGALLHRMPCLSSGAGVAATSRLYHKTGLLENKSKVEEFSGSSSQDASGGRTLTPEEEQEIVGRLKRQLDDQSTRLGSVPVFKRALQYGHSVAIKDQNGEFSYARLYMGAKRLAADISSICGTATNSRIAFLCSNDVNFPLIQWACWMSGQIAVPLSPKHPEELLKYFITDSDATLLIATPEFEPRMKSVADSLTRKLLVVDHASWIPTAQSVAGSSWLDARHELVTVDAQRSIQLNQVPEGEFYAESNAMLLYTSGTTGNPKGVILSHKNLEAQIQALTHAWQFTAKDCLLHVLPLNHVHGCVNALLCPLDSGAKTIMLPRYENNSVWSHLLNVNMPGKDRISVFMAVPTMYSFLIDEYDRIFAKDEKMCEYIKSHCSNKVRLMVSGSAKLPTTVFDRWHEISGHRLLERYGMTEIGMALSNPYVEDDKRKRIPGTVGHPLPGVEAKIKAPHNQTTVFQLVGEAGKGFWQEAGKAEVPEEKIVHKRIKPDDMVAETSVGVEGADPIVGDLYVRGPMVFRGYWNKPEASQEAFFNGWFKTGDTVSFENGVFKILGRTNIDIIKTGGNKVSALEVETILLEHPLIADCAVLGLPDAVWGQKVGVIVQLNASVGEGEAEGEKNKKKLLTLKQLNDWCVQRMASYAVPKVLSIVENIPRNAMGKVNKKEIIESVYNKQKEMEQQKSQQQEQE